VFCVFCVFFGVLCVYFRVFLGVLCVFGCSVCILCVFSSVFGCFCGVAAK